MFAAPLACALDTGDIVVAGIKGEVHFTIGGSERVLRAGAVLEPPAAVRTGRDGAVELRQGATVVNVGPDTQLEFPALEKRGGPIDRIVQPRGNAFYDIGKREGRKLRVETPYLVGVVKGTQFNVAAQENATTISLFEGLLEIRASDDSAVVDIKAGEIASRKRDERGISVIKMDTKAPPTQRPPAGSNGGDTPASPAAPRSSSTDDGESLLAGRGAVPGSTGVAVSLVDAPSAEVGAGIDVRGGQDAGAAVDVRVNAVDVGAGPAVDVAAAVDVGNGSVSVDVGAGAAVGAGPANVEVSTGVNLDVGNGSAAVDVGVSSGVDLGPAAAADVGAAANVDLGSGVSAGADLSAGVDAGPLSTDAAASAAVDVGNGAGASVDLGASADLANVASVDTAATVDVGAGTAANVDVGAAVGGVDAGVSVGVDLAAGNVDLGVNVAGVDLGVDLGLGNDDSQGPSDNSGPGNSGNSANSGTDNSNPDNVVDSLLNGLLRKPGKK